MIKDFESDSQVIQYLTYWCFANDRVLKTIQPYYQQVRGGGKTAELRVNDRDFQPGQFYILAFYNPEDTQYHKAGFLDSYCLVMIDVVSDLSNFKKENKALFTFTKIHDSTQLEGVRMAKMLNGRQLLKN